MAANRSCQTSRVSGPSDRACVLAGTVMLQKQSLAWSFNMGSQIGTHLPSSTIRHQGDRDPAVFYVDFL